MKLKVGIGKRSEQYDARKSIKVTHGSPLARRQAIVSAHSTSILTAAK
jgi:hypothetical protein